MIEFVFRARYLTVVSKQSLWFDLYYITLYLLSDINVPDLAVDFFENDTPHGYAKRFMWMRHLQAFVGKTQSCQLNTIIYDGFAGAGVYSNAWDEDIAKYGSPLIAVRVSIEHFIIKGKLINRFNARASIEAGPNDGVADYRMTNYSIRVYLVEGNISNFNKLVKNVGIIFNLYAIKFIRKKRSTDCVEIFSADDRISISCRVSHERFENVDPPHIFASDRLVAFIDPFGYTHIPMSHVSKFVGFGKEIYINYMSQYVNRFFDVNEEGMQQIFGMDKAAIESRLLNYKSDRLDNCVSLYKDILKEKCTKDTFLLSFEMRNLFNVRLYHMIFISCHEKGLEVMKEAMNRGSQEKDSFSLSDFKILKRGQNMNLKNGQDDDEVARVIYERFYGEVSVSIKTVRNFVIHDTIFVWRKGTLKNLYVNNKITNVLSATGQPPQRRGTFPDRTEWFLTFAAS